ncbi:MAG: hypothetical protein GPJ09_07665 [Microcystis aeruginosa SX13-01]|nr:hypothetical protein [Microcystis aeruginosa SX13-01]
MLTKIINIEARWMRSVTDFLPAGDYKVEYIGVAQGGQYNAWSAWPSRDRWLNNYVISSSQFSNIYNGERIWADPSTALANAKNTNFVLTKDGNVTFWIDDSVYEDNTGGISLRVTSIPTPATNITLSNSNIAENQAVNTVIGDFTSTDPDPGDTFTYSLVAGAGDTDNSFFTITGSQLRTKAVFDFETKKTYSIRVKTTDQDGQFYEKQLTVNVTNIIEPGTFSFSDNNYVVKEDGTAVKAITIKRTDNFEGAVSVTVTPTDGTATSTNDYNNTSIVVNFAAGETSKTVTVPLINDTAYELEENLNLAITNVTGGAIIGTQNTATLTILNDDAAIRGVLAFSTPTYTITENGTPITQVIVNRTGGSDTEVSATITVNNGTATADDYNNTPIKVTFAHGDSAPKIITIPIKEDSQFEAVETLNLSLINPTNGVTIGSQNTAIVKIIDNDNFVFTNTDIQPTKLEQLTLPIPTALKQYETLSSELDKAKVKLDTTEEQLTLANDDYSFAKETFAGSLSKQKSLTETLQNLGNKKTALTSSFTQSKTQNEQKQKDIQKNIDNASTRLKAETNAGLKDGIQKEINGYLIQIQQQQNLLSIATTKYDQELGVIDFQISESNQDLQALTSNIIPKQVEELEKKNQALVAVKTAWEANKQAVTVADKALGDFLTDYAFLKTQDYSSKFLQDTVNSLNQKISNLQTNLTSLKNSNGSTSEISALEKAILEKQKIVGEVQDYGKTVLAGEVEFKQELETRKTTSADHLASVKVALGNNNIEGYVTLSSQLANQLKGLTTVWVDDLQDNHNLTIKVWNGLQAESQAFDSLTSYIDENLATPYGDYYLNEIQLDEALQIQESTVRRRDALADSVNFVTDALFLAKKQLQEYQDLAKLSQHYSDLTSLEKQYVMLTDTNAVRPLLINQLNQELTNKLQDLVIQIDLTNDQQEQGLETNLQKYIEQKQNSIVKAQETQLTAIRETFQQHTHALFFDGVNDYINMGVKPSLEVSSNLTIEAWINPQKQIQVNGGIIVNREGEYEIAVWDDGTIRWAFANTNPGWNWINTGYVVSTDKWTHIAVSYENGLIKTYANGSLVYSYDGSGSLGDVVANQDDFRIGGRQATAQYFKGQIDDVRVWNTARTQAEIQTYYNRNLTGKEPELIGYWNFEESAGNTVYDLTANKNNGTLIESQRTVDNPVDVKYQGSKAILII